MNCGEGVQLNNTDYTDFMIMIPPGNCQGWSVVIKTEEPNTYYKSSTRGYDVAPGSVLEMKGFVLGTSDVNINTTTSYVENGVYLGKGIQILWAPVNCGYEKAIGSYKGYTWGKLYQWGRDSGCGYSYDSDASIDGFMSNFSVGENWSNDPCPDGWRVPTKNELQSLEKNLNTQDLEDNEDNEGQKGCWYGLADTKKLIFFQAAGYRDARTGAGENRGKSCIYWSSTYEAGYWVLNCKTGVLDTYSYTTALPIRCVKVVN